MFLTSKHTSCALGPELFFIPLMIPLLFVSGLFFDETERFSLFVEGKEDSLSNIYLEFYEIESTKNTQVIIDRGLIMFEERKYKIVEGWKGSFLNQDKLFFMSGHAESLDDKIQVFVMGRFLERMANGSLYEITAHIHSDQRHHLKNIGEITRTILKDMPKKSPAEPEPNLPELLFLVKSSYRIFEDQQYTFSTKLYDKKQNPTKEWNVKGGQISGANVSINVYELHEQLVHETNGKTNEFGWFEGKLPKEIAPAGQYYVTYSVQYQNSTASATRSLFILETKQDANFRHFTPTAHIGNISWNDGIGNNNGILYDDIDENQQDDSDAIRSQRIGATGGSTNSGTAHFKMSTYAGVTTDHSHYIYYTIGKDASGGSELRFTVTLYEGNRQIAQWTHLDVDEGFEKIVNVLTREQADAITDYGNLSLEFVVDCTVCESGADRRRGQISWVHMLV